MGAYLIYFLLYFIKLSLTLIMWEQVVICTVPIKSMKSSYLPDLPVYPQLQMKHVTLTCLHLHLNACLHVLKWFRGCTLLLIQNIIFQMYFIENEAQSALSDILSPFFRSTIQDRLCITTKEMIDESRRNFIYMNTHLLKALLLNFVS